LSALLFLELLKKNLPRPNRVNDPGYRLIAFKRKRIKNDMIVNQYFS